MLTRPQSSPVHARYTNPIGSALYARQEQQGFIRMMPAGDSTVFGAGTYEAGIRNALCAAMEALGVEVQCVGDVTPDDGEAQWLVNCFGNQKKCQAIGNISTRELVRGVLSTSQTLDNGGTAARTFSPLETALIAWDPDFVPVSIGINDNSSGTQADYALLISKIQDYARSVGRVIPIIFFTPYDGCTVTNEFPTVNATFNSKIDKIRAAILANGSPYVQLVNSQKALGYFSRYPNRDPSVSSDRANGYFVDGVHLGSEGEAMRVAFGLSSAFGMSPDDLMRAICNVSFFRRVPWEYSATVSGASVEISKLIKRKNMMTSLIIHNTGGGTGVYTLARRRYAQNGSTVISTTTSMAWTIPTATPPVGLVWPSFGNMEIDGGLPAWYNESWYFTAATSACEIKATGHYVTN